MHIEIRDQKRIHLGLVYTIDYQNDFLVLCQMIFFGAFRHWKKTVYDEMREHFSSFSVSFLSYFRWTEANVFLISDHFHVFIFILFDEVDAFVLDSSMNSNSSESNNNHTGFSFSNFKTMAPLRRVTIGICAVPWELRDQRTKILFWVLQADKRQNS